MVELKNPVYATMALSTQALHADKHLRETPEVSPSVGVTTTFLYKKDAIEANNYGASQRYVYSREGRPNTTQVESTLSTITEGHAVVFGSGLTAALAILMHYKPKKVAIGDSYFGIRRVLAQYSAVAGNVKVVSTECSFEGVDLVWLESPVNPTGEIKDISCYALRAHAAGAKLVVDATLAPPPLSYPFRQGADVIIHSASKYLGGHEDLLAGVVVSRAPAMAEDLRRTRATLGLGAGSLETWLLQRSLTTLSVRVTQQAKTAARLVALLESFRRCAVSTACHQPSVADLKLGRRLAVVKHASLQLATYGETQHPNGYGAVFAVSFASKTQALFVAKQLRLHSFATSLGGVHSLVDWRHGVDPTSEPTLLRVSVGLESFEDLAADWRQALTALDVHETASKL
ncbi:hypothetical protein H4S02_010534 [Coemansia sp. RSA 2611]|nr:hypothetical protein GGI06_001466 [Coemansia sp. S85]KAJ2366123.1 hypothetical protein H4S02_010534 [Coemansia sp. RSA 2611]KAJ2413370.1 hypothetical protein GGI10_003105 [Coemansia sp. RSA 2530]KAJ2696173.1 hypothetical protein H4218_004766 [Coemansia sp. IMI 209128]